MPLFRRRQLQLMLDVLGPWVTTSKALDLVKRLGKPKSRSVFAR